MIWKNNFLYFKTDFTSLDVLSYDEWFIYINMFNML